ncbi:hypothetical protein [Kordia zhangzhouensis]|uniref:hypothetical protein n=1 Tax=Kordia zhangzhouensis TaxID=1620405 RepID=UPI00062935ED|nr:hypothetical protein [Kordia zhangzhouensis]
MKPLKLNKIKISKLSEPHSVIAGLIQNGAQQNPNNPVPFTYDIACLYTKDKDDSDCANQTNGGGTMGRTGIAAPANPDGI